MSKDARLRNWYRGNFNFVAAFETHRPFLLLLAEFGVGLGPDATNRGGVFTGFRHGSIGYRSDVGLADPRSQGHSPRLIRLDFIDCLAVVS